MIVVIDASAGVCGGGGATIPLSLSLSLSFTVWYNRAAASDYENKLHVCLTIIFICYSCFE